MARRRSNPLDPVHDDPRVREAARALVETVREVAEERALSPDGYAKAIAKVERARGRALMMPMLASGQGNGARVRMADGSEKLDFIGGIGVYAFGHGDDDLVETAVAAAAGDVVFQGHLLPGPEYLRLSQALVKHAGPRIKHAWLAMSGAMANENALKMILQKHAPADRIVTFERAFHGRTLAMAEMTDKPAFRDGLPLRGNVLQIPFFDDPDDPEGSTHRSVAALEAHARRYPGQIAAMCFELVQGEGGFHTAPREFFVALMECCRRIGAAVWADEVQTFARTGELFAYRKLELEEYVDLVSVGKVLQGSATLVTRSTTRARASCPVPMRAARSAWPSAPASSNASTARATSARTAAWKCSHVASTRASSRCASACRARSARAPASARCRPSFPSTVRPTSRASSSNAASRKG